MMMAVMLVLTPAPVKAQTTFAVAKILCPWTNAPQPPDPGPCLASPNQLNQGVLPGQPVFYLVTIVGNANTWTLTLNEIYPPGFAGNVQDVRCVDAGNGSLVFTGTNLQATSFPISIGQNQTLHCTIGGYFTASTATATDASNTVNLTATGGGGATGTGTAKVTAIVDLTPILPTDLSITKTASTNSVALGGTVTFTIAINNDTNGQPVFLGGFLRLFDRLAILSGSMSLKAKLTGPPPTCTATAGASCLDPTPFLSNSPLAFSQNSGNPTSWWPLLAEWHYASGNPGFLPPGGSMTLVYTLQIDANTTCAGTALGHGFSNFASFDLLGQAGATVLEGDSTNNSTTTPKIDVTHTLPACLSSPNPDVSVTKVVQNPQLSYAWGSPVSYVVTITNNAGVDLEHVSITDSVDPGFNDTAVVATLNCGSPCPGPGTNYSPTVATIFGSTSLWTSGDIGSIKTSQPPGTPTTFSFPVTVTYDMDSCATQRQDERQITNIVGVWFETDSGWHYRSASVAVNIAEPPACDFQVTKTFKAGAAPTILSFNTPYQYELTFTNQSALPATIYTLADLLRVDAANYAVSMPLAYGYSCAGRGVSGHPGQSAGYPSLLSGQVQYAGIQSVGATIIMNPSTNPIRFGPGATLTCTVDIVVQRPAPGDPNCMGTGAAGLQNTAILFPSAGYYFGAGVPPVASLWADERTPLPRCFNLTVNKAVNPPAALGTGPPLAYTITVTNNGDPITGLAPPNWLTLTDIFAGTYSPGTASVAVTNPAGACGPAPTDNCEFISSSGNPMSLGIKNFASGQVLDLTFPLAPPFTTENVRNDVAIQAQGTLATDWYAREPNTLINFKEVPITNPASEGTAMLKVCKVAGEGVEVGMPYEFTATAGGTGRPVTVPAGPPPGGYCQIVGTYAPGTAVVLAETVPAHHEVAGIAVAGAAAALGPVVDTAGGKVDLKLDTGVSEATFTNIGHGYVEICKAGEARGLYRFTLDDRPLEVPGGACTAAIELRAGMHRLVELEAAETVMVGCGIWPASRRIDCPPGGRTVIFEVRAGGIETQSVVTVTNGPARPAYSRGRPAGAAARR